VTDSDSVADLPPVKPSTARRRATAVWVVIAVGVAAAGAVELHGAARVGVRARPNVLLLVMDTTRADRCSFLGYGRPTTPCLAQFAKDAVSFREAYTPGGWTGPAHASLFTGLRPDHHGFHDGARNYLDFATPTLATQLQGAGWATACFTNNAWIAPEFGLTRGFDRVEAMYHREDRPYPWAHQTHTLAVDWAGQAVREGRQFFLFVNDMEPHLPYSPPPEEQALFLRTDPTPEELNEARTIYLNEATDYALGAREISPRVLATMADLYDAEIATLDREIGVLFGRMRAEGLLDSTIVVVVGDHGEPLGEHHMIDHGHTLHHGTRHVPLLIRYPGAFDGGRIVDFVVRLEDVAPTILELCGLAVPEGLDGKTLSKDLAGRISIAVQGAFPARRAWIAESNPGADPTRYLLGLQSVYDGRYDCLTYSDGRRELFDDAADPAETDDLSAKEPAVLARLLPLLPWRY
jgi:arylsulfatase A-like enzyme